jgi:acyl-CoA synthetase (AMP-forming)/AMP-acid ligase II/acyl carrier protein
MINQNLMPHNDVLSLLRSQARSRPSAIALLDESGKETSYEELYKEVEHLALQIIKLCPFDNPYRIGMVMDNGKEMSVALLSVACIGAVLPFDPRLTQVEYESYYSQSEITHLLVDSTDSAAIVAAEQLGIPVIDTPKLVSQYPSITGSLSLPDPESVAMVLLTSGSTGRPKRVPLTHKNVCVSAYNVASSIALTPEDICLSMWELFHVGGLVDLLLAPLHSGGKIIVTSGFDASAFFTLVYEHHPTWVQVVPTTLHEVVQVRKKQGDGIHNLRFIRSVAAALTVSLKNEAESLFNVPVIQTYGMTEASPLIASTLLPPAVNKPGSVGVICGGEVSILGLNEKSKRRMEPEGELIIRGENVFSGYEGVSAEEHEATFIDGWYRTGDIGHIEEDGTIYLIGRLKEVINRGGEKVNMHEVDEALLSHPAVKEAACFAVKHPTLGEDVVAAVILKPDAEEGVDFRVHVAKLLAAHKVPREVLIHERFPRTRIGKIDRNALGALYSDSSDNATRVEHGDELQQEIAVIWKTEIGVEEVNLDDDFLKLGGDSLSAVRMILEVEKEYKVVLPDDVLGNLTSIRSLAAIVSESISAHLQDPMANETISAPEYRKIAVVMGMGEIPTIEQTSLINGVHLDGKQKPLVWFFNSPATEMLQMSQYLDADIPLYGCYSGGRIIDGNEDKLWRMAQVYASELEKVFPDGEIHIGGNCRGGRLALKVIQILLKKGYPVLSLSVLELGNKELYNLDLPILCMFGSASKNMAYKGLDWGRTGWKNPFKQPAYLVWTKGTHGGFFREDTICSITSKLEVFLSGQPVIDDGLSNLSARLLLWLHRLPGGYFFYRKYYKFKAYFKFGHRKTFNPLTGRKM